MKNMFWALSLTLFSAALTFGQITAPAAGQSQDDHDDNGPIQAGYAVVTPSFPGATGILVTASFGLRRNGAARTQAAVAPPALLTRAVMFVDVSDQLFKNLGLAIVNPNNGSTDVTVTLRKNDGTQLATKTITIAARRQVLQYVTEMFGSQSSSDFSTGPKLPAEFTGALVLTSTTPISVIGLRFRDVNFSTMPVTTVTAFTGPLPTLALGVGGAGATLFPEFAAGGGWATEIVIANTGTASVTVRVDLFKQDGTPLTTALNGQNGSSFTSLIIPAGGVLVLAPRDRNGNDDF